VVDPAPKRSRIISRGTGRASLLIVGRPRRPITDLYHWVLTTSWLRFFGILVGGYLLANVAFATGYILQPGSIENSEPGSFSDAFFFSVQTMATIGYGAMAPGSLWGHVLVTAEAFVGLVGFAMATGIMFAKFARPTARVLFSDVAIVAPRDGVRSLQFRMANQRGNQIVEATLRVILSKNEVTVEGERIRRFHDMRLVRATNPLFVLTWTAIHPLDETSPMWGETPESLLASQAEIIVSFVGLDETFSQTVHARHSYVVEEIRWDHRFRDVISVLSDGVRKIDYSLFHDVEPLPGN